MAELQHLRVLLTRPEGRGNALSEALANAGAELLQIPLLQIDALCEVEDADLIRRNAELLECADQYSAIVFISTNAVAAWQAMHSGRASGQRCYAIGAATAAAATAAGCNVVAIGSNSETLLAQPEVQHAKGRLLIVRGVGGREYLAEALRGRGLSVDYLDAYRRSAVDLDPQSFVDRVVAAGCNLICAYSGETVSALDRLLAAAGAAKLRALPLLVPGERVAAIAKAAGFTRVAAAADAAPESMLHAISSIADEHHG